MFLSFPNSKQQTWNVDRNMKDLRSFVMCRREWQYRVKNLAGGHHRRYPLDDKLQQHRRDKSTLSKKLRSN